MRMVAALAIAGLVLPAGVQAEDADTTHDIQCFVATGYLADGNALADGNEAEDAKLGLAISSMYFAGKIYAAEPEIDLAAAAKAQLPFLTDSKLEELRTECGEELIARNRQIFDAWDEMADDAGPDDTY